MTEHDARKLPPKAQEDLRKRVVKAVQDGMNITNAARVFQVSRQSIHNWMNAVDDSGHRALCAKKRGPKKRSRTLAPHQAATLVRMITASCPDQLRLPFALWTRQAVCDLAEHQFGVEMSVTTAGRYLSRWNLTPQKPLRRAYERDPQAIEQWLDDEYPHIERRAKRQGAEIHWGDQMGLRSDHQTGTSYGRRGQTPVVPGTGQRFRCNVFSSLTNRGSLAFMVFTKRFNADVFIEFMQRLIRHAGRKVFFVVDRHPSHCARKVKDWLAARRDQIELFYLPPYAPELNPDEYLNQDIKSNALGRRRPQDQDEMKSDVRSFLHSTQKQPEVVMSYFQADEVQYAS